MKVRELIGMLRELPQDAEVRAYDAEDEAYLAVTGAHYTEQWVELSTDAD